MNSTSPPVNPWYREPWPWLLMLGPFIVIVAGFVTLYLAIKSDDGLVAGDYYKQGLAINRVMQHDAKARELGLHAQLVLNRDYHAVRIFLAGAGALPGTLSLHFIHPGKGDADEIVKLQSSGNGLFEGRYRRELSGRRHLILEDQSATWRIGGEWRESDVAPAELNASSP